MDGGGWGEVRDMKMYSECGAGGIITSTATCQHTVCAYTCRKIEEKIIFCLAQKNILPQYHLLYTLSHQCVSSPSAERRQQTESMQTSRGVKRTRLNEKVAICVTLWLLLLRDHRAFEVKKTAKHIQEHDTKLMFVFDTYTYTQKPWF